MIASIPVIFPVAPRSFAPPSDALLLDLAGLKVRNNPASPGERLATSPEDAILIGRIPVPMSGSWDLFKGEDSRYYIKYTHYTVNWFQASMPLF